MKKVENNGSRMMLTELIFSIFFFMVIVAVCIQLFASAFITEKKSKDLATAVNICANVADKYAVTGDIEDVVFYDIEGSVVEESAGIYKLSAEESKDGAVDKAKIVFTKLEDETEVYSLEVERSNR